MDLGGENSARGRRTQYREEREEFIEAFQSHFPGDSRDADRSFDELFDIIPEGLARHNQGEFSNDLEILLRQTLDHLVTNTHPVHILVWQTNSW